MAVVIEEEASRQSPGVCILKRTSGLCLRPQYTAIHSLFLLVGEHKVLLHSPSLRYQIEVAATGG